MRRVVLLFLAAACGALVAFPAASQPQPDQPIHRRIERSVVLDEAWRSTGGSVQIYSVSTTLPSGAAEYDVVASAALEMRTTSTDHAAVSASYHVESGAPHPPGLLPPQSFRFVSPVPGRTSTSTALWSVTLAATNDPVTFAIQVRAVDGPDRGETARASGKKLTLVIDVLPSDD